MSEMRDFCESKKAKKKIDEEKKKISRDFYTFRQINHSKILTLSSYVKTSATHFFLSYGMTTEMYWSNL